MSAGSLPSVVRQIESLFDGGSIVGLTDRELIERFIARRDVAGEAAFAALVCRHGPMVLDICQLVLGDRHHTEDAFQAVFLVLACKAPSIRNPDLLANWLYGVALRTARKRRAQLARDLKKQRAATMRRSQSGAGMLIDTAALPPDQQVLAREQAELLYGEIERLPLSFRLPVVLCYFEGLTLDEAAHRLRCPPGTVRSRLARACEKLRRGLTRRGVALPAASMITALTARSAQASVESSLCASTTRGAVIFATRATTSGATSIATTTAQEVLHSMLIHKIKLGALFVVFLGSIVTCIGYTSQAPARQAAEKAAQVRQARKPDVSRTAEKPDGARATPGPGRMFVVGRVLDPQGNPVPDATVMTSARAKLSTPGVGSEAMVADVIGNAQADKTGRFRLDASRTSSSRNDMFLAVALAPGYGAGWVEIDPDADQPSADIKLQSEQVIHGRLIDVQGQPARGVVVSVSAIVRMQTPDNEGPVRPTGRVDGPHYGRTSVNDWPAWPRPTTTDADGRFTMRGVGRGLRALLTVIDPRFAVQNLVVDTDQAAGDKALTLALVPAKIIAGRVTYADTGRGAPLAPIVVTASGSGQLGNRPTYFKTDVSGRFRLNPSPGDHFLVSASPPAGEPYLAASHQVDWPTGAIEQSLDLSLPRGVRIRGKVTEEGTNRPVAAAALAFMPQQRPDQVPAGPGSQSETAADGSFTMAVPSQAGYLAVKASSEDYVFRAIGNREFFDGQPGGRRLYSHAFVPCHPKSSGPDLDLNISLRRGITVTGRAVGPDDQPVAEVWILGLGAIRPNPVPWTLWQGSYHLVAFNGRFELHGLDPDVEIPVLFLEPKRKLGATLNLGGKSSAGKPITARLEPCAVAQARLVNTNGRPVAGYRDPLMIAMTLGPSVKSVTRDPATSLREDGDFLSRMDLINYRKFPASDTQGRIVFPALIPGALYRIIDDTAPAKNGDRFAIRKEFAVKSGETLDLGDILIEKPQQ